MTAVIQLTNVSKKFLIRHERARSFQDALVNLVHGRNSAAEEFWALKNVSFEVHGGETIGIVGTNGSGKSTILKLITQILEPTSGSVTVQGHVSALIELGAGFHPDLTGRENIYLNGSILGFSHKEMGRRFEEIVAFSELERFIDTPVKHYSSGMYMRLGFSVAISVDPDILIIDEVLSVGDSNFQRKCLERIDQFRRQGKTILIVSHSNETIERLCDRAVWIDQGVVRAQGAVHPTVQAYLAELRERDEKARELEQAALEASSVSRPAVTSSIRPAVQAIRLAAPDGSERYSFQSGDSVVIRVALSEPAGHAPYAVVVQLRRSDGLLLYATIVDVRHLAPPAGEARLVELVIPHLNFLSGSYVAAATAQSIGDLSVTDDSGAAQCRFSVWSNGAEAGLVALAGQWQQPDSETGPAAAQT
jgi:lipopolysaccharide transport system ATP-binding protein